jgi:membrane protein DedA with SNARE-associated domain
MVAPFSHASYLTIVVALVLTGMGLPVPEEFIVIFAGIAANQGVLQPWPALAACLAGALLGDCLMYSIGYHFGRRLLREQHWFSRFLSPARERRIEQQIKRHGIKVFFLARFLVGLRSPVFITAGILRVPFRRFICVDLFCGIIVVSTFFGLSYVFTETIQNFMGTIRDAEIALTAVVVAVVGGAILFFVLRRRRRWARVRLLRARKAERHRTQNVDGSRTEEKSVA